MTRSVVGPHGDLGLTFREHGAALPAVGQGHLVISGVVRGSGWVPRHRCHGTARRRLGDVMRTRHGGRLSVCADEGQTSIIPLPGGCAGHVG